MVLLYPFFKRPSRLDDEGLSFAEASRDVSGGRACLNTYQGDFLMQGHRLVQRRWAEPPLREPPWATENKSWPSTCLLHGSDPARSDRLAGWWITSLSSCWFLPRLSVQIGSGQRRSARYLIGELACERGTDRDRARHHGQPRGGDPRQMAPVRISQARKQPLVVGPFQQ